jgi:serine/arginine repetitive matrix protein 2
MPVFASDPVVGGFMGAGSVTNANRGYSPKAEESQGVSISPPTVMTGNASSGLIRPSPSDAGDSRAPSQPKPRPSEGPSFHAELENTEDARKRKPLEEEKRFLIRYTSWARPLDPIRKPTIDDPGEGF